MAPAAERWQHTRAGDRGDNAATITGMAVVTAYGRGTDALLRGVTSGQAAFSPVTRFEVSGRRTTVAATMPQPASLTDELVTVIDEACDQARLSRAARATTPLLLAVHADPDLPRAPTSAKGHHLTGAMAAAVATRAGLATTGRAYTTACVAASTAVADAAAMIRHGLGERVVVAGGYLVEPDQFALFDAGRALARDGAVRPFSAGRTGLLLGDGVGAVVIESRRECDSRGSTSLSYVDGWGRAGDAHHVVAPRPDGAAMAIAIISALSRAGISAGDVGYLNAHGSGSVLSDSAEAAAIARAFGPMSTIVPVSSTKSLHGQSLEASPLIELITTVVTMRAGQLPPNAGYLGPDDTCPLNLIIGASLAATPRFALSLNAAFGGANTALVLGSA